MFAFITELAVIVTKVVIPTGKLHLWGLLDNGCIPDRLDSSRPRHTSEQPRQPLRKSMAFSSSPGVPYGKCVGC